MTAYALNFVLYYAGWFACILGPAWGFPWTGTLIALALIGGHLALARRRADELTLMLCSGGLGLVLDSLQIALGTLSFQSGVLWSWMPPPWLIVLWMQFATTFHYSMRWLQGRPLLAASFGAVGGPLAFYAGRQAGVLQFDPSFWPSIATLAVVWAFTVPALLWLAARQSGRDGVGEYRVARRRAAA